MIIAMEVLLVQHQHRIIHILYMLLSDEKKEIDKIFHYGLVTNK